MQKLQIGDLVKFNPTTEGGINPLIKGWVYKDKLNKVHVIPEATYAVVTKINKHAIDVFIPGINKNTIGWARHIVAKI